MGSTSSVSIKRTSATVNTNVNSLHRKGAVIHQQLAWISPYRSNSSVTRLDSSSCNEKICNATKSGFIVNPVESANQQDDSLSIELALAMMKTLTQSLPTIPGQWNSNQNSECGIPFKQETEEVIFHSGGSLSDIPTRKTGTRNRKSITDSAESIPAAGSFLQNDFIKAERKIRIKQLFDDEGFPKKSLTSKVISCDLSKKKKVSASAVPIQNCSANRTKSEDFSSQRKAHSLGFRRHSSNRRQGSLLTLIKNSDTVVRSELSSFNNTPTLAAATESPTMTSKSSTRNVNGEDSSGGSPSEDVYSSSSEAKSGEDSPSCLPTATTLHSAASHHTYHPPSCARMRSSSLKVRVRKQRQEAAALVALVTDVSVDQPTKAGFPSSSSQISLVELANTKL